VKKALTIWIVVQVSLAGMYMGDAGYFVRSKTIAPWCTSASAPRAFYVTLGALWPLIGLVPNQHECDVPARRPLDMCMNCNVHGGKVTTCHSCVILPEVTK
jgi:hypothetical protein